MMKLSCYCLIGAGLIAMNSAHAASVSVAKAVGTVPVNLSDEGSTDWVNLGWNGSGRDDSSRNEKSGVDVISTVVRNNGRAAGFNPAFLQSWTGGDPTASATDIRSSWEAKPDEPDAGGEASMTFTLDNLVAGDYQLKIYATTYQVTGTLNASIGGLSDSSFFDSNQSGVFTVDFTLDGGDSLALDYAITATAGGAGNDRNVGIAAITVSQVPEPSASLLVALSGLGLLRRRRR